MTENVKFCPCLNSAIVPFLYLRRYALTLLEIEGVAMMHSPVKAPNYQCDFDGPSLVRRWMLPGDKRIPSHSAEFRAGRDGIRWTKWRDTGKISNTKTKVVQRKTLTYKVEERYFASIQQHHTSTVHHIHTWIYTVLTPYS